MAEQQAEGLENVIDPNVDPNAADPNADPDGDPPESNGEDSPYAPLAKDMGWTPRDQYDGPAESWKDAETFIRDGRDIQRETSRELKALRGTVDTMVKTSASLVEQQVNERVDQLTAKLNKAVDDGDTAAAFKISREIDGAISSVRAPAPGGPSPDAQAFAERNASWFNKPGNEYATARAVEICNTLQAQGYTDHGQQLRIAEQRMRQEMPQLFKAGMNGTKPAPGVNQPGSRAAGASNRQKGFSDMPKAAQDIARDMADRLGIKTEDYARNYFANEAAKG